MTSISQTIDMPLSADAAQEAILKTFEAARGDDGTTTMPLRVSLRDFGLPDHLAVERDVTIQAVKRRDAENINDEIAISWRPTDGGPFPVFTGRLVVWSEDRPDACFVELQGSYEPPLGTMGEVFDAAIGRQIAERTAHTFLTLLKKLCLQNKTAAAR
ncbi:MAG TPA: hypothetical protein VGZ02_08600 [Candidatus Baltobacteraceae bacterium]|nr:hypothetical protein [Candidatus Baltobacteraceae bacterium]